MKVSLWAEIRRLHEVEGLSRRAISERLHCCRETVSKALAMSRGHYQRIPDSRLPRAGELLKPLPGGGGICRAELLPRATRSW